MCDLVEFMKSQFGMTGVDATSTVKKGVVKGVIWWNLWKVVWWIFWNVLREIPFRWAGNGSRRRDLRSLGSSGTRTLRTEENNNKITHISPFHSITFIRVYMVHGVGSDLIHAREIMLWPKFPDIPWFRCVGAFVKICSFLALHGRMVLWSRSLSDFVVLVRLWGSVRLLIFADRSSFVRSCVV